MAISARFLDELKARLTLSELIGRKVKLVRRGKEHSGLCPFHSEKTPSFTVNDQKGFYHCFGCGAHGSAIDFVMNVEGLGFRDAVESLAASAGMEMPQESPEDRKRAAVRASHTDILDAVAGWYHAQLMGQAGQAALEYARGRGLAPDTIEHFRLGYAPAGRTALKDAMAARKISEADLVETGMLIAPEDGGAAYDRFRDRLMFPIKDARGAIIAFGGRALSPDARAKYLNSPDTPLFDKGQTLYNRASARKAAFETGELLIVEGYMDVIALAEAGMNHVVAPLGTALTEAQMAHAWAMADEPVLAFDGDKAGLRAAARAAERALPLLKAGKSLRFLILPAGEDPDSLVRKGGREVLERLVDGAIPLVDQLWNQLIEGAQVDTPERLAGLEKKIFTALQDIVDEDIRRLYQSTYRERVWTTFKRRQPPGSGTATHTTASAGTRSRLRHTEIGRLAGRQMSTDSLERLIVTAILNHPALLARYDEQLGRLSFADLSLEALRCALLLALEQDVPLERIALQDHLQTAGYRTAIDQLLADSAARRAYWFAFDGAALSDAITGFEQGLSRFWLQQLRDDLAQAEADCAEHMTEDSFARVKAIQALVKEAEKMDVDIVGFGLESNKYIRI